MKAVEIRGMSPAELNTKLEDLKKELFHLRFQHATNQPVSYTHLTGHGGQDLTGLALVFAVEDDDLIALLDAHFFHHGTPLNHFRSQGQDSHIILVAELAGHRAKDTGALGRFVFLDQDLSLIHI